MEVKKTIKKSANAIYGTGNSKNYVQLNRGAESFNTQIDMKLLFRHKH